MKNEKTNTNPKQLQRVSFAMSPSLCASMCDAASPGCLHFQSEQFFLFVVAKFLRQIIIEAILKIILNKPFSLLVKAYCVHK